jgi:hypothetical protein
VGRGRGRGRGMRACRGGSATASSRYEEVRGWRVSGDELAKLVLGDVFAEKFLGEKALIFWL